MKEIIEYITTPGNIGSFFLAIAMLAATIVVIEKFYTWATSKLKNYYDFKRGKEKDKETEQKQEEHLNELDNKLDTITNKVDEIVSHLDTFVANQKNVNTVLLRDKIYYIYKDALRKGYILDKDKQNFKFAYDEYIANGGNSYIRDEVEPFIHGLKVYINDHDAQKDLNGKE